jgi:ATP-binding cassette subfamily F protein 3
MDEVISVKPMLPAEARNYLALFLFTGDDVFRTVDTLSGGERGRVALAKLALTGANLLLLDEPTNHLDIDSQEVLQSVLADFGGTVILVTHDRYLVDALATQIWSVRGGQFEAFEGSYQEFLAEREKRSANAAACAVTNGKSDAAHASHTSTAAASAGAAKPAAKKHGLNPYQHKIRLAAVEEKIQQLEVQIDTLTDAIDAASASGDSAKVRELSEAYNTAQAELDAAMAEWELLLE